MAIKKHWRASVGALLYFDHCVITADALRLIRMNLKAIENHDENPNAAVLYSTLYVEHVASGSFSKLLDL